MDKGPVFVFYSFNRVGRAVCCMDEDTCKPWCVPICMYTG